MDLQDKLGTGLHESGKTRVGRPDNTARLILGKVRAGARLGTAGLQVMELLMQEEVRELVGERSQRQAERTANRWGSEQGYCVVMGRSNDRVYE